MSTKKNKNEVAGSNPEAIENSPEVPEETVVGIEGEIITEIKGDVTRFISDNALVAEIEKSEGLSDPDAVKKIKDALHVAEIIEGLDKQAKELAEQTEQQLTSPDASVEKQTTPQAAEGELSREAAMEAKLNEVREKARELTQLRELKQKFEKQENPLYSAEETAEFVKAIPGVSEIFAKIEALGIDFDTFQKYQTSDNPEEEALFESFKDEFEGKFPNFKYSNEIDPEVVLSNLIGISPMFKNALLQDIESRNNFYKAGAENELVVSAKPYAEKYFYQYKGGDGSDLEQIALLKQLPNSIKIKFLDEALTFKYGEDLISSVTKSAEDLDIHFDDVDKVSESTIKHLYFSEDKYLLPERIVKELDIAIAEIAKRPNLKYDTRYLQDEKTKTSVVENIKVEDIGEIPTDYLEELYVLGNEGVLKEELKNEVAKTLVAKIKDVLLGGSINLFENSHVRDLVMKEITAKDIEEMPISSLEFLFENGTGLNGEVSTKIGAELLVKSKEKMIKGEYEYLSDKSKELALSDLKLEDVIRINLNSLEEIYSSNNFMSLAEELRSKIEEALIEKAVGAVKNGKYYELAEGTKKLALSKLEVDDISSLNMFSLLELSSSDLVAVSERLKGQIDQVLAVKVMKEVESGRFSSLNEGLKEVFFANLTVEEIDNIRFHSLERIYFSADLERVSGAMKGEIEVAMLSKAKEKVFNGFFIDLGKETQNLVLSNLVPEEIEEINFPSLRDIYESDEFGTLGEQLKSKLEEALIEKAKNSMINGSTGILDEKAKKLIYLKLTPEDIQNLPFFPMREVYYFSKHYPDISDELKAEIELGLLSGIKSMANQGNYPSLEKEMVDLLLRNLTAPDIEAMPVSSLDSIYFLKDKDVLSSELQAKIFEVYVQKAEKALLDGDLRFIAKPEVRELVLANVEAKNPGKNVKKIRESFYVSEGREKLPAEVLATLERFEKKYGPKGRDLIALAVAGIGMEDPGFAERMKKIEITLDKYKPENIPEGAGVSMGTEYEIRNYSKEDKKPPISGKYSEASALGYKGDALLIDRSANIGEGRDGLHEYAFKGSRNPFMIMAEIYLMREAGLLDFNFNEGENFENANRGYHLSMVGDTGLNVDNNLKFLGNMLILSQLAGLTSGRDVDPKTGIHEKGFDNLEGVKQGGVRCEIKGMSVDKVEQFEESIITSHHAGIAIQMVNKYIGKYAAKDIPKSAEEFEDKLIREGVLNIPFGSDQERDIVYQWMKLQQDTFDSLEQHNSSFMESEFDGGFVNKDGEYIDTSEHIDTSARDRVKVGGVVPPDLMDSRGIRIPPDLMYGNLDREFIKSVTRIGSIFLKQGDEKMTEKANPISALKNKRQEGYREITGQADVSIIQREGKFRHGYFVYGAASEGMILHDAQIKLALWNTIMEQLLSAKGVPRATKQEEALAA